MVFLGLACLAVKSRAAEGVDVGRATSPDGATTLVAAMDGDDTVRIEVKTAPTHVTIGRFDIPDFSPGDSRYTILTSWKPDSTAFALNISHGRSITECRVFTEHHGGWIELPLPQKPIERARRIGNKTEGPSRDYLSFSKWLNGGKVEVSYQGNTGLEYALVFKLLREGKPRLAFLEIVEPKPPAPPKFDYVIYRFAVLAGNGEGDADGRPTSAQFRWPQGMALDAAGNVFVADRGNHTIRKISREGIVETFAGSSGQFGLADGTGRESRLWYPVGLTLDARGNLYVADSSSNSVRKISPQAVVSTLARDFKNPTGVTVDREGNVYVADANNFVVRKIAADGAESTVAGVVGKSGTSDGPASEARFSFPRAVAVTDDGTLYVVDRQTIRKIDTQGTVTTFAGSPELAGVSDGRGTEARFSNPRSVALDAAGNLYVADDGTNSVRRISPAGRVQTIRGSDLTKSPFARPVAVALDREGALYVSDEETSTILRGEPAKVAGAVSPKPSQPNRRQN